MRSTSWIFVVLGLTVGCSKPPPPSEPAAASVPSHASTFTGRARTVEGRAVLFATDGKRVLVSIPGGGWPKNFEGRLVVVSGELQPNPSATGADDHEIVVNAQVKLLE